MSTRPRPESYYRHALDLNRYSNSVAKGIIQVYNDIFIQAARDLQEIDEESAPFTAERLRSIIAQIDESLQTWANTSIEKLVEELQQLTGIEANFVRGQLQAVLPAGSQSLLRTVEISPDFARSVVTQDPLDVGLDVLSDDLRQAIQGSRRTFRLDARKGALINLPNGKPIGKAFRGIAESQTQMFAQIIRQGLLAGETTQQISRKLIGRNLRFNEDAKTIRQIKQSGGLITQISNRQVHTLVRTVINQVANEASEAFHEGNQDVTGSYEYVATLDTRTTARCRSLDGQVFRYGEGPRPPQHFGCRSTIIPVIDYEALGLDPPSKGKRAAAGGMVPEDTTYGEWLAEPFPARGGRQPESKEQHLIRKARAFGLDAAPKRNETPKAFIDRVGHLAPFKKSRYFDRLVKKHGPQKAISKMVSEDGSELTLKGLAARYDDI